MLGLVLVLVPEVFSVVLWHHRPGWALRHGGLSNAAFPLLTTVIISLFLHSRSFLLGWTAATTRAGAFAFLAGAYLPPDRLRDDIVLLRDIPFQSHCEHHLAPIIGKAAIAYLPGDKVVGISKLARVLHGFARRLQVQERLTAQVADCIWDHLQPKGVAVVIEASHACMTARGVQTPGVMMTTSRMMGTFREDERSRREVLALMGY